MTRKDYQAIAEAINKARENELAMGASGDWLQGVEVTLSSVAHQLCKIFEQDNPRFDSNKFLNAANIRY